MPTLNLPTPGVTPGPGWASQVNDAFETLNNTISAPGVVQASDFGVSSDNPDNRSEFLEAFNAVPPGGTLEVAYSESPYLISEALDFRGKSFTLQGNGSTISRVGDVGSRRTILLGGGVTQEATTITSGVERGSASISVSDSSSLSVGDVIQIRSKTDIFDLSRPTVYFKGEIAKVSSISGTTVSLSWPTVDQYSYSPGNLVVDRIQAEKVSVRSLRLSTGIESPCYGLSVIGFENLLVDDVHVIGFKRQGIQIGNGFGATVSNSSAFGSNEAGIGYGVVLWGCDSATIENFIGVGNRHTVDIGGGPTDVPARNIVYRSIRAYNDTSAGISSHGQYERLVVDSCVTSFCGGGIVTRGPNTTIINNTVVGMVTTSETYGSGIVIGDGTDGNPGRGAENLVIANNTVDLTGAASSYKGITIFSDITNTVIRDNLFINAPQHFIYLRPTNTSVLRIKGNTFRSNRALGAAADYMVLIDRVGTGTVEHIEFTDNKVYCADTQYISLVRVTGGANSSVPTRNVKVTDNYLTGYGTNAIQLNSGYFAGVIDLSRNEIPQSANHIGVGGNFDRPVLIVDNKLGGTAGYGKESSANSSPGSGTWERGQVVWNTQPAASGFIGWVCVSAGTPGTWKGFGSIQS